MVTATKNAKRPKIPTRIRAAIREVLDYNWPDELRHYAECRLESTAAELASKNHVFLALVKVRNWLDGMDFSADEYCERDGYDLSETAHA